MRARPLTPVQGEYLNRSEGSVDCGGIGENGDRLGLRWEKDCDCAPLQCISFALALYPSRPFRHTHARAPILLHNYYLFLFLRPRWHKQHGMMAGDWPGSDGESRSEARSRLRSGELEFAVTHTVGSRTV